MGKEREIVSNQQQLCFRKGDLLAVAIVLMLALAIAISFLPNADAQGVQAQVYQGGQLLHTLNLEQDQTVTVRGRYTNIVTVENGAVSFTASDCPGEDCVHSGSIHASGRSLVCLPNGVEVRIVNRQSDVDFVVG